MAYPSYTLAFLIKLK